MAASVVVALAVGAFGYLSFNRGGGGTALALTLSPGQSVTYQVRFTMNGTISIAGQSQPFSGQMSETVGWKVTSVNAGVATVHVTLRNVSGQVEGQRIKKSDVPSGVDIKVAADGRVLSGGDLASAGSNSFGFPGTDQFTPLLPDRPVGPGDTWSKSFQQSLPFADGALSYSTRSTFLRYQTLQGVRTAVLSTTMDVPLDYTVNIRRLLAFIGQKDSQIPAGSDPSISYGGSVQIRSTSWFDPTRGQLVQSASDGTFDMTMKFAGFPAGEQPPGDVRFVGSISVQAERQ